MARTASTDSRTKKVTLSMNPAYDQQLKVWSEEERRDKATWANMLLEKLIDARTLIAQGREVEAEAVLAEVKANCANRTRDLRFTKPLVGLTRRSKKQAKPAA